MSVEEYHIAENYIKYQQHKYNLKHSSQIVYLIYSMYKKLIQRRNNYLIK